MLPTPSEHFSELMENNPSGSAAVGNMEEKICWGRTTGYITIDFRSDCIVNM